MTYRVDEQFDALGDPRRREILRLLADGPATVGALAARLPISRPAVSQHLRVLKAAGLVRDLADGTRRIYSLDPTGPEGIRAFLDRFWVNQLTSYAQAVEQAAAHPRDVPVRAAAPDPRQEDTQS